jgi:pyruvate formate lyase activating enzyme
VIGEGQTGWCRTRTVRGGRLHTLTYGRVSSLSSNPIEKKPLYHFYPGSHALTAGSWSCNFACPWCQNWHLSKSASGPDRFLAPEAFVSETLRRGCRGTSISFNEPTLSLEWSLEVFRASRKTKPPLYNTFVTNGYMTAEALRRLAEAGLDALNIDLKGTAAVCRRYCQAEVAHVWENCKLARQLRLHLELTTLIIPGVNDDDASLRGLASRIVKELGRDVPWHVNAYAPAYRFRAAPPTPAVTLTRAQRIGLEAGLDFVYIGNVEGDGANTYCPGCRTLLVRRLGLALLECRLTVAGTCPECGRFLPGVGWDWAAEAS